MRTGLDKYFLAVQQSGDAYPQVVIPIAVSLDPEKAHAGYG